MEPRRKWADSDSDDEIDGQPDEAIGENIITSLKTVETNNAKPVKTKKKKVKKEEPEEKVDPNLVTKIVKEAPKVESKHLRSDGTTASKKEQKNKEMEELNKLLEELGTVSTSAATDALANAEENKEDNKTQGKGKKGKSNKKEIFENVRSEIAARTEKSKKNKKKEKFHNY